MSSKQPTKPPGDSAAEPVSPPPPAAADDTRYINQIFYEKIFGTPEEQEIARLGRQLFRDLPGKWQKYLIKFCRENPGRLAQAVAAMEGERELLQWTLEYAREIRKFEQELEKPRGVDTRGQTFHI